MAVNDLYTDGIAGGWNVKDASGFTGAQVIEADVVVVGTGAGGGTAAEILAQAGLRVLMVEEGALWTSNSFKAMDELRALRDLYVTRATADGGLQVLQGRNVGGGTTVNTTSSFRTPEPTLKHWAEVHGVRGASAADMAPWFAKMEQRLGIAPWGLPPNRNNDTIRIAAEKLGWEWHVIPRNVRGCVDSGYCTSGCPVNAKQSMLVTTVPGALQAGAALVHHLHARRLRFEGDRTVALECQALDASLRPTGATVEVRARHYVLSASALGSPALLLRSEAPDPHRRIGQRVLVHPHVLSFAHMPQRMDSYYGAPQSISSDEFQWKNPPADAPGFKMEAVMLFPASFSSALNRHGRALVDSMRQLPYAQTMIGLVRDGFDERSRGGTVTLADDGSPALEYEINDYVWAGVKHALRRQAEAQFAAGAVRATTPHFDTPWFGSWDEARAAIDALPNRPSRSGLLTTHLMGGCTMGEDPRTSVADSLGRHHHVGNLSILDGSLFPTSIGANPQLSIYGLVAKNATALAAELARPA